jgi:hypothetical protein
MNRLDYTSSDLLEKAKLAQDEGEYRLMDDYLNMAVGLEKDELEPREIRKGRMEHLLTQIGI